MKIPVKVSRLFNSKEDKLKFMFANFNESIFCPPEIYISMVDEKQKFMMQIYNILENNVQKNEKIIKVHIPSSMFEKSEDRIREENYFKNIDDRFIDKTYCVVDETSSYYDIIDPNKEYVLSFNDDMYYITDI